MTDSVQVIPTTTGSRKLATILLQATHAIEYDPTNLPPQERWLSTKLGARATVVKDHNLTRK